MHSRGVRSDLRRWVQILTLQQKETNARCLIKQCLVMLIQTAISLLQRFGV